MQSQMPKLLLNVQKCFLQLKNRPTLPVNFMLINLDISLTCSFWLSPSAWAYMTLYFLFFYFIKQIYSIFQYPYIYFNVYACLLFVSPDLGYNKFTLPAFRRLKVNSYKTDLYALNLVIVWLKLHTHMPKEASMAESVRLLTSFFLLFFFFLSFFSVFFHSLLTLP